MIDKQNPEVSALAVRVESTLAEPDSTAGQLAQNAEQVWASAEWDVEDRGVHGRRYTVTIKEHGAPHRRAFCTHYGEPTETEELDIRGNLCRILAGRCSPRRDRVVQVHAATPAIALPGA